MKRTRTGRHTRGRHAKPVNRILTPTTVGASTAAAVLSFTGTAGIFGNSTPDIALAPSVTTPSATYAPRLYHRTFTEDAKSAPAAEYIVVPGDTLSLISHHELGNPDMWPLIWKANRGHIHNPNLITVGQRLRIPIKRSVSAHLWAMAMAAIPKPPPPPPPPPPAAPAPVAASGSAPAPVAQAAPAPPASSGSFSAAAGSFQQCVITRESGGNAGAVNPSSGAGGLYQFLPSTWAALGHSGLPENASVAEQNQAFQQEYAQSGTSAWSAYDGC